MAKQRSFFKHGTSNSQRKPEIDWSFISCHIAFIPKPRKGRCYPVPKKLWPGHFFKPFNVCKTTLQGKANLTLRAKNEPSSNSSTSQNYEAGTWNGCYDAQLWTILVTAQLGFSSQAPLRIPQRYCHKLKSRSSGPQTCRNFLKNLTGNNAISGILPTPRST